MNISTEERIQELKAKMKDIVEEINVLEASKKEKQSLEWTDEDCEAMIGKVFNLYPGDTMNSYLCIIEYVKDSNGMGYFRCASDELTDVPTQVRADYLIEIIKENEKYYLDKKHADPVTFQKDLESVYINKLLTSIKNNIESQQSFIEKTIVAIEEAQKRVAFLTPIVEAARNNSALAIIEMLNKNK